MFGKFLNENKGQGEWNTLYMVLILGIVAVVLVAVVKPMFKESIKLGSTQEGVEAKEVNPTK